MFIRLLEATKIGIVTRSGEEESICCYLSPLILIQRVRQLYDQVENASHQVLNISLSQALVLYRVTNAIGISTVF